MKTMSSIRVDDIALEYARSVAYARTVDWYLIKLQIALDKLADRYPGVDKGVLLEKLLTHPRVREVLEPLACERNLTIQLIEEDPRHKALRPYARIIASILDEIECSQTPMLEMARDATYRIEYEEARGAESTVPVRSRRLKPKLRFSLPRLSIFPSDLPEHVRVLIILSIIGVAVYLLLRFLLPH